MKKVIPGILIGLAAGVIATSLFLKRPEEKYSEEKHEEKGGEEEHKYHVEHGTNGETIVKLDKETQERMGLKVAALQEARVPMEVKGYGHVIDPTPLAMIAVEDRSARASLEASGREYERLKALFAQEQNVSTRALEAAEAAMKKDQILLEAAKAKLALTLGHAAMTRSNLQELVESLISLKKALVRIDVPLGESLPSLPTGGRVAGLAAEERPMPAQLFGAAPTADPQTQGQGFLFLLSSNALPPGSAVVGWLQVAGDEVTGVSVPRAAVIRHEGEAFVYVQTDEDAFERKEIELDRPLESGWFVHGAITAKQNVVVVGGQQLLSEELKGEGGEEE